MREKTIAIHGGCHVYSTRPVAAPNYQTVAYDSIDAEHDQLPDRLLRCAQAGLR
jgi:hypothetical protein